jgi:phosphopantothenate-cysteine ligase/phosphopantothenoylcysteine decarboxylase/phosphopantothenate--cysteine ligase
MNVLVTAGNTQTPIDSVRCITNIFSGRTGARVAAEGAARGHTVTLLTSHPEVLRRDAGVRVRPYRTFDDLDGLMAEEVTSGRYDAVVHAAAVSDYRVAGVFAGRVGNLEDAAAGKVKSHHPELWLRLVPAPKLIDKVRAEWGFAGVLTKFKVEFGVSDAELLGIAERSRVHSGADLMCANTLEGMHDWAFVGTVPGGYRRVSRADLPSMIIDAVASVASQVTRKEVVKALADLTASGELVNTKD